MKSSVSNRRIALATALFLPALLLLALPFYTPGDVPVLLLMLGRFHPVILHFPIVLIIVALILEIMRRSNMLRKADLVVTIILVTAAISSVIAIASGFLLYASGDYSGLLLERHLWIGVITGTSIIIAVAFFFIWKNTGRFYPFYFVTLLISNGAVAYTSHLGGALTHGEDYLTEYIPLLAAKDEKKEEKRSNTEMLVYDDMIMPVFEAKCISCHNESRTKGELSMTSLEKIIKGGESENPGIIPGNADSSELYKRIVLPEGHEDRMPPEGKTPMTPSETALLRLWIQGGGNAHMRVQDALSDSNMAAAVNNVLPHLQRYRRKQLVAEMRSEQLRKELDTLAWQMNIVIQTDSTADEDFYTIAMKFPPAPFNTEQLKELAPYGKVFSKISLVSSGIEDEALYQISKMENLRELYLQKTNLNGSGLVHLKNLKNLEVLNLSYTKVNDRSLFELLEIPNLREVYLFQTSASPDVIKALQAYKPSLKFLVEEGPYL